MTIARKSPTSLSLKHAIYGLIAISCLIIRGYAAHQLPITKAEASILLQSLYANGNADNNFTVWNQILSMPIMDFFGTGNLAVRFWVLLASCTIPLLPLFFEEEIGERAALIWAFFLALDPFQIANSLQIHGNTFAILLFLLCTGFFLRGKYLFALLCLLALTISGTGGWAAIIFMLAMIGFSALRKENKLFSEAILHVESQFKKNLHKWPFFIFLAAIIIFFMRVRVSASIDGFLAIVSGWNKPFAVNAKPTLFPIALAAYLPLGVICAILLPKEEKRNKVRVYLHFWITLSLLLISIYPGHKLIDLGWTSLAVWLFGAINLDYFLGRIKTLPRKNLVYGSVLLCILISISLTASGLLYQIHHGMNPLSQLLAFAVITIIFCLILLLLAFNESFPKALLLAQLALLAMGTFMQFSSSWRTSGISTDPSQEILWEGYFQDVDLVNNIIQNADLAKIDGIPDKFVAFVEYDNAAIIWAIQHAYPTVNSPHYLPDSEPAVIIAKDDAPLDLLNMGSYYGQRFVSDSYPLWIWEPLKSIANSDFWYWLWFRMGQKVKENSIIWVNHEIF